MIDPQNIIQYNRTHKELEQLLFFCVCVAGKSASTIAPRVNDLTDGYMTPWDYPKSLWEYLLFSSGDSLATILKNAGIGCFNQRQSTVMSLNANQLNLKTCTVSDLEGIFGIGPKTARFFLLSSRRNVKHAALDTHLLKWLKSQGIENVPKSTPNGKQYARLEKEFLNRVPKNQTPAEFDLEIWKKYANNT